MLLPDITDYNGPLEDTTALLFIMHQQAQQI